MKPSASWLIWKGSRFIKGNMNKKGVTLIELIIVFVIIAIGAVLIAPNIGAWLPNYRLRSATRDIVSTMRTAQMKAVSSNTEYRVKFDQGAGSFILQYRTIAGGPWTDEGVAQKLPTGIQIFDLKPDDFNAEFNPNSTSTAGSVTLRNTKGAERRIVVTAATGRVRVE
jgi:prepilin-type N-terminal cleavage/methylation domain-containing protein